MILYQLRLAIWTIMMNFIITSVILMFWCNIDIKGQVSHEPPKNHSESILNVDQHFSPDPLNQDTKSKNDYPSTPTINYEDFLRNRKQCLKDDMVDHPFKIEHLSNTEKSREIHLDTGQNIETLKLETELVDDTKTDLNINDVDSSNLEPDSVIDEVYKPTRVPTVPIPDAKDYKAPEELDNMRNNDNVEVPVVDDKVEITSDDVHTDIDDNRGEEIPLMQTDDIPSFDEWKKKMLQEQEQKEKSKMQGGQVNQNQIGDTLKKNIQNRVNYASITCGGKLQTANSEAQNTAAILTENKDQYMIQPCKAKKWFVIELCEPVKVEMLELGNQELFSSLPQSFVVSVSDRYPAKEWKVLGTFKARDERKIQSFSIDDDMYAKYLKMEMLSHYGKEHYCPLSVIRIYGQDLHEDDGEADEGTDDPLREDLEEKAAQQNIKDEEHSNLFNIAKDTVTSLVHSVLNGNSDTGSETDDVVKLQNNSTNATSNATGTVKSTMEPCVPDTTVNRVDSDVKVIPPDKPEVPDVKTFPDEISKSKPLVILVERPTIPISVFLEKCHFCDSSVDSQYCAWNTSTCAYYQLYNFIYPTCCVENSLYNVTENLKDSETHEKSLKEENTEGKDAEEKINSEGQIEIGISITDTSSETKTEKVHKDGDKYVEPSGSVNNKEKAADKITDKQNAPIADKSVIYIEPTSTVTSGKTKSEIKSTPPLVASPSKKIVVSSDSSLESVVSSTIKKEESSQSAIKPTEAVKILPTEQPDGLPVHGPNLVQVRPSQNDSSTDDDVKSPSVPQESSDGKPDNNATSVKQESQDDKLDSTKDIHVESVEESNTGKDVNVEPQKPSDPKKVVESVKKADTPQVENQADKATAKEIEKQTKDSADEKIIYAEIPSEDKQQEGNAMPVVNNEEEMQVNRFRSLQKETTYMKLKNKIRELEINLTLSSRYLEELSVKYKQRMEDMYKSLNKTIQKLTNTSKTAEIRDLRQQERISVLEKKLMNLTMYTIRLTASIENVHGEVIERHLYILLIECVIFLAVMGWCLHTQKHHYRDRIRTVSNSYFNMATKTVNNSINIATSTPMKRHRRGLSFDMNKSLKDESFTAIGNGIPVDEIGALKKSGSENDVTFVEPMLMPFVCPSKKKKKKKHANTGSNNDISDKHLIQNLNSGKRNSLPVSKSVNGNSDSAFCNGKVEHSKELSLGFKSHHGKKRVHSEPVLKNGDIINGGKHNDKTNNKHHVGNHEKLPYQNGYDKSPRDVIQNGNLDSNRELRLFSNFKSKNQVTLTNGTYENDSNEFSKINGLQNTPTKSSSCLCFSE